MKGLLAGIVQIYLAVHSLIRGAAIWVAKELLGGITKLLNLPPWVLNAGAMVSACVSMALTVTGDYAGWLVSQFDKMNGPGFGGSSFVPVLGTAMSICAKINAFAPLDEGLAYVVSASALFVLAAGVRMVKACIPTVA